MAILLDAFKLEPEEAVKFFRQKGFEITFSWQDLWQEAHAKAFTVAGVMKMDILMDIRDAVDRAISEGKTFQEFKKEIEPILQRKGWWGHDPVTDKWMGTPWRLRTIFATNIQSAYQAGRYRQMAAVAARRPYWQYLAVLDRKTRPSHARLHGRIFPANDPFWDHFYPPNGWNCRCHVRSLSRRELERYDLEDRVESSEGRLTTKTVPLSKRRGSTTEVVEFDGISPDPGFSSNPGKTVWRPNLDEYEREIAERYVTESLEGPDFERFFFGKSRGNFPVAIFAEEYKKAIEAKSQVVLLSDESLAKNIKRHPELKIDDYRSLPQIIGDAHLVVQDGERTLVFYKRGNKIYYAVVKATKSRRTLFLTSFRLASHSDVESIRKKGRIILDRL